MIVFQSFDIRVRSKCLRRLSNAGTAHTVVGPYGPSLIYGCHIYPACNMYRAAQVQFMQACNDYTTNEVHLCANLAGDGLVVHLDSLLAQKDG